MENNTEIKENLGIIFIDTPINKDTFNIFAELRSLNKYSDKVDFCMIEEEFDNNQVIVKFKAVHASIPTMLTVPYTYVTFRQKDNG